MFVKEAWKYIIYALNFVRKKAKTEKKIEESMAWKRAVIILFRYIGIIQIDAFRIIGINNV